MVKIKRSFGLLMGLFFVTFLQAQQYHPDRFFIQFKDKANTQYSFDSPRDFLSARALQRREAMNLAIDSLDLPVNASYIDSLRISGAEIHSTTKWLNGAVISVDTLLILNDILKYNFVGAVDTVRYQVINIGPARGKEKFEERKQKEHKDQQLDAENMLDYGYSLNQIRMLGLNELHNDDHTGRGVWVAVLDGGFSNVDKIQAFEHLFDENRIKATRDFVDGDNFVFEGGIHGQYVLSIMAAHWPGQYIGAAPDASYLLLRSEDVQSEFPVEELNWASAAEYADSLGADIINSSLGYTTYDYPPLSHSNSDMDGNSTWVSRAADIAAKKGILVVSSAGNEGNSSWFHVSAPADGDSVLAVGAINQNGNYASFSSKGPSADGDIKPNVTAVGANTAFLYYDFNQLADKVAGGNGTSFSAPLISGASASLKQAFPDISNMELKQAIEKSASQYREPDSLLGYGVPDFQLAGIILRSQKVKKEGRDIVRVMPSPFRSSFYAIAGKKISSAASFRLYDLKGAMVRKMSPQTNQQRHVFYFSGLNSLKQGVYVLKIRDGETSYAVKVMKAG